MAHYLYLSVLIGPEEGTLLGFFEKCNLERDVRGIQAESVLREYFDHLNPRKEAMDVILAIDEFQSLLRMDDGIVISRVVTSSNTKTEWIVSLRSYSVSSFPSNIVVQLFVV
jgi:hypothetical protein